jgi:hypothetical protein
MFVAEPCSIAGRNKTGIKTTCNLRECESVQHTLYISTLFWPSDSLVSQMQTKYDTADDEEHVRSLMDIEIVLTRCATALVSTRVFIVPRMHVERW